MHADLATILHLARTMLRYGLVEYGPVRANGRKTYHLTHGGLARMAVARPEWLRAQERAAEVLGGTLAAELETVVARVRSIPLRHERARLRMLNYYDVNEEAREDG